jgi:hypothetical protein
MTPVAMRTPLLGAVEIFWDVFQYLLIHTDFSEDGAFTTLVTVFQSS